MPVLIKSTLLVYLILETAIEEIIIIIENITITGIENCIAALNITRRIIDVTIETLEFINEVTSIAYAGKGRMYLLVSSGKNIATIAITDDNSAIIER